MIFNKHPHKTCKYEFNLKINSNNLVRVSTVKYLGVIFDENLTWSQHLKYLSSQLAKHSALFYRLRYYVSRETLCMLYFGLIHGRALYGITFLEAPMATHLFAAADAFRPYYGLISVAVLH